MNNKESKSINGNNILIGLGVLIVFGLISYMAHEYLGIDLSRQARTQTAKDTILKETKLLSQLEKSETKKFRDSFIADCTSSIGNTLTNSQSNDYCSCTEERVESNYTVSQVNSWNDKSSSEVSAILKPHYETCARQLGLGS